MKKVIAILLAMLIIGALTACGSTSNSSKADVSSASASVAEEASKTEEVASSTEQEREEKKDFVPWPAGGLYDMLPKPSSNDVLINYESDTYISVEVHNTTQEDYTEYVEKLKGMGYIEKDDAQHASHVFDATNADGYELMSSVASVSKIMYIQLMKK